MAVTQVIDASGRVIEYDRRRPEQSVFYRIVQDNLQTLYAEAEAKSDYGFGYPSHVKHEFERFLSCGVMSLGFARVQCERRGCNFERLVAYACKGRCICPSCVSRRMADCAAHLCEHVLPKVPYRQWTLSLPYAIRFRIGYDKDLLSETLSAFLRTVFSWQRLQARRQGIIRPLTGAVTLCQRFGSILQFSPHWHSWLPDGVFTLDEAGALTFHRLPPPSDADIEGLVDRIGRRIERQVQRHELPVVDEEDAALAQAQSASIEPPIRRDPRDSLMPSPLCTTSAGYSLHANLGVHAKDRAGLERGLRYGLRPPFSHKRLSLTPDGKVRLKLRKPYYTGQTEIRFEPVDFLRRVAATVPPKRLNLVRFHGIFAPNANARPALKVLLPQKTSVPRGPTDTDADAQQPTPATEASAPVPPAYRRPWAELLKRVFDLDVLICPQCGHTMHRMSHIDRSDVIVHILGHLGLPSTAPMLAPARAPPQLTFDFDDCDDLPVFEHCA